MANKKNKTPKAPKKRIWAFTKSQTALIQEQARQHQEEQRPLLAYQQDVRHRMLNAFREELGIDQDQPLTVELNNLRFVEGVPAPAGPVPVPTSE